MPDIDGNAFGGRYRAFLRSTGLPLKATMHAEWHDDRLFAWLHYVPFDNSYMDIYAVMEYLLANDAEARAHCYGERVWGGDGTPPRGYAPVCLATAVGIR